MNLQLQMKMNEALFFSNPKSSELGKNILKHSVQLIYKADFEAFILKKLTEDIGTVEAGILTISLHIDPPISEQSDPLISEQSDPPVSEQSDPLISEQSDPLFS